MNDKIKKLKRKYYVKFREGMRELGNDYDFYKDVFELAYESLPSKFNIEATMVALNGYQFLTELEMMNLDIAKQDHGGCEVKYNEKDWWLNGFIEEVYDLMQNNENIYAFGVQKNSKNKEVLFSKIEVSENINKSIKRAEERIKKWMKTI